VPRPPKIPTAGSIRASEHGNVTKMNYTPSARFMACLILLSWLVIAVIISEKFASR